ncbi:type II secretion system protein GspK [Paraliomyxa miuraensis]|uniref:type II secretion system protein GspK n=1 Tax=Paraliomyxa miuraensis TaxID=376150 RepID=UPI0022590F56|nr:type II secretion system protein GspK [Paraliomyxa miuraensis]MCX4242955.1 type II secretion system protein GspK [Paraliomyxa miuraensis]
MSDASQPIVCGGSPRRRRPRTRAHAGQHGVAVLLVIACLAIVAPFTASFNYQARVDWQSAINVRDEVTARQIQRGAMQLSLLLFEVQRMVFNQKQFRDMVGSMDITQVAPYLMSVFGTEDGAEGLGAMVGIDTSALSELAISGGSFEYRVAAESGKINVNCLAVQPTTDGAKDNPAGRVIQTVENLMLPTLYDPYFEEQKSDGQYYTRSDIVRNMADYIDDDINVFDLVKLRSASSRPESYRYTQLFDPYQERNARLDTVEELHLVEGIDDDWMAAFGHELTVYGGCKVNLNFASADQIALVLQHSVSAEDKWKTEGENFLLKTLPLANYVVESREFSLFKDEEAFKDLVAQPDMFISPLAALGGDADQNQNLPRIPEGMEVRVNGGERNGDTWGGIKDVATVMPESIYRIEVFTEVGAVRKHLTAVYDMKYARQNTQGQGAWLYIREE